MGASAKRRKEKKADFAKPKLKVGKARPKNTNATDTSFTAKSIVLKQQSVAQTRDATALFNHNLSLLGSRNEVQRRDALQHLTAAVVAAGNNGLPQPTSSIVQKVQPLILDANSAVRQAALKFLRTLTDTRDFGSVDKLLLYARAGTSHLSTDIRLSALDVLDWLLERYGDAVMECAGGWIKTIQSLATVMGWQTPAKAGGGEKWTSVGRPTGTVGSSKLFVRQLNTLAALLTIGMTPKPVDEDAEQRRAREIFPLANADAYLLPTKSNPFGYLNLLGLPRHAEDEAYPHVDDRISVFKDLKLGSILQLSVGSAMREGGEVGRAAARLDRVLRSTGELPS
ncbi:hypothetical protein K470DRAFT_258713 [Piedraia hortae CBS 480.64]|uniref:Pre-rRNA-processing protein n=1 Tax=Piedraia hortae CBS 480.64 TaxID=1314780 RepID=A0A6A7BWV6_9PEZI|nr:hypothetical protein K470DRAFT_258713 [Piedraia hortae CBS 480.64]